MPLAAICAPRGSLTSFGKDDNVLAMPLAVPCALRNRNLKSFGRDNDLCDASHDPP
jgi:hypothetical protein